MTEANAPCNVLIAGGGVAALEAALALRALAEERVSVELLAPEPFFWYRPLAVLEPFHTGRVGHFALSELAAAAGATFTLGGLASVEPERRVATTEAGALVPYDLLLIAAGADPVTAIPGALTFRGPADTERIERLLGELADGAVSSVAFVVPPGTGWTLPVYELALMTAAWAAQHASQEVAVGIVTPEAEPLQLFGPEASGAVRALLDSHHVGLHCDTHALEARDGELLLAPEGSLEVDRVVAGPSLRGRRIEGIPQDADGFIDVDAHCRVVGVNGVFAAGDATAFPVKQGGIAAQQALAAAESIAAEAGADITPKPFRPVLRGLLLTESEPRYLRHELARAFGESDEVATDPLWWPPAKIVGKHLAPFLGALAGAEVTRGLTVGAGEPPHAARLGLLE
jgi:sulfide:quinone oxidoreductase